MTWFQTWPWLSPEQIAGCLDQLRQSPTTVLVLGYPLDGDAHTEQRARELLNVDELQRADRFVTEELRRRFRIAHGVLRSVLKRMLACEDLQFAIGSHGKPALSGDHPLHFNLSHSGDRALLALAWERSIGVDLERHQDRTEVVALAQRWFSPTESATLRGLNEAEQRAAFFATWTHKEAVVKALGTGLHTPLDQFSVTVTHDVQPTRVSSSLPILQDMQVCSLNVDSDWSAALAAHGALSPACHRIDPAAFLA